MRKFQKYSYTALGHHGPPIRRGILASMRPPSVCGPTTTLYTALGHSDDGGTDKLRLGRRDTPPTDNEERNETRDEVGAARRRPWIISACDHGGHDAKDGISTKRLKKSHSSTGRTSGALQVGLHMNSIG